MDLVTPLTSIAPSLDGAALSVLAGADTAMSATQIQRIAGRGSRYGLVLVLERLSDLGLVTAIPGARGSLYRLNRDHVLAPAVVAATQARSELERRLAEALESLTPAPVSAALYGSVARGDATADSDIDLLIVVAEGVDPDDDVWVRQVGDLEQRARSWSGNTVQAVTVPRAQLARMVQADEHIVSEWERDARTLTGVDTRGLIRSVRKEAGVR